MHEELVVLHGLKGRAQYLLDGQVYEIVAGTLLWAQVGQAHVLLSDTRNFDMWVFLVSDAVLPGNEEGLPPLRVSDAGGLTPRAIPPEATRELSQIADGIGSSRSQLIRRDGLRWWLARAWHHWTLSRDGMGRQVHAAVSRAAELLRDDPTLTLATVAGQAGMSPGRLSKLFKRETGQGVAAFRTEQKLGRVEAAIAAGESNLLKAAMEAGFGSYPQFYRSFLAGYGISPRAYFFGGVSEIRT